VHTHLLGFAIFILLAACGSAVDDVAVTTGPALGVIESTTSTGPIETTTTTTAPTTTTTLRSAVIRVTVANGAVEVKGKTTVQSGARVTIKVTADVEDTAVLVGYDVTAVVTPDQTAELIFQADVAGTFPVTLDSAGLKLFDLEVAA
jgi:ABC-type glycerol-3-phosphate transport system substrate-binding protein